MTLDDHLDIFGLYDLVEKVKKKLLLIKISYKTWLLVVIKSTSGPQSLGPK